MDPDTASLLAQLDADLEADTSLEAATPLLALAADYLTSTRSGEGPVSTWHSAQMIVDRLSTEMPKRGRPLAEVARRLATALLDDVNRLAHPMYIGHQVSAPLPAAVWTDALISAFNQSLAVREMSPSFTPLEHQVIAWMTDLVGWEEHAGGTMTSGGTEATFTALLAARARAIPNVWTHGMPSHGPVLICSEHTHYAVARAAGEMGLGLQRIVTIPANDHRMDIAALRAKLQQLHASHIKRDGRGGDRGVHRNGRVRRPQRNRRCLPRIPRCTRRSVVARGRGTRRRGTDVANATAPRRGHGARAPLPGTRTRHCCCRCPQGSCSCATRRS